MEILRHDPKWFMHFMENVTSFNVEEISSWRWTQGKDTECAFKKVVIKPMESQ